LRQHIDVRGERDEFCGLLLGHDESLALPYVADDRIQRDELAELLLREQLGTVVSPFQQPRSPSLTEVQDLFLRHLK
jgi:hypothetical protein